MADANGHIPPEELLETTWEGDRMFNIYIHDYCVKHGYILTAQALVREAGIQDAAQPPINAKQGLLFEWWNVFWTLFSAKSAMSGHSPTNSEDALIYLQNQSQRPTQPPPPVRGPPQQSNPQYVNGVNRRPHMANGIVPNGVANGGATPMVNGNHGTPFANGQANGIPGTAAGANGASASQPPTMQSLPGGQRLTQGAPGQQPNAPGMQGGPQPLTQMNRTMLPPNAPGVGPSQAPQLAMPHIGRSPSQPASPGTGNITPSPSMQARQPQNPQYSQIPPELTEISRLAPEIQQRLKQEAGVGDKDMPSLTPDERQRLIVTWRTKRGMLPKAPGAPPVNAAAGPSNPQMQQRNLGQPPTPQMSAQPPPNQRGSKRSSTSPGQEAEQLPKNESSPPDKKRPRRTPGPEQQQPQLPPQQLQQPQQQPMQPSGAPFQHPLSQGGSGGQGGHQMGNVMRNPMLGFPGQPMHQMGQNPAMPMSMGANMSGSHMGNAMSSGMMGHPPPPNGMPMSQMPMREAQYRQAMHQAHQNKLPAGLNNLLPQGTGASPSNADGQLFPGGQPGHGGPHRLPQNKPIAGMGPPPSPGMNAPKIMAGQSKDGASGDSSAPNASPQNAAAGVPQGPAGIPGGAPGSSTAPPTPSAGMPAPSPSGMMSNGGTPAMAPSHPPVQPQINGDMLSNDFLQSVSSQLDTSGFGDSLFRGAELGMDFEHDFNEWFNPDTGL